MIYVIITGAFKQTLRKRLQTQSISYVYNCKVTNLERRCKVVLFASVHTHQHIHHRHFIFHRDESRHFYHLQLASMSSMYLS